MIARFIPTNEKSVVKHVMPCSPDSFQRLTTASTDEERDKMRRLPYLQLIGSLLYLQTMTRPDISYHMSILCSLMHDPSPMAYYAAIDLLLYTSCTRDYHFHFPGSVKPPNGIDPSLHACIRQSGGLVAYSDASWRKPDKLGFSMFGFVVFLFGAPISFTAKRLKVVAMSSAEAEYAAASYTCKEIAFIRGILSDLGFQIRHPTVLAVDNQAAIQISQNQGVTKLTKHFTDAVHYFRHQVEHLAVTPTFVRTHAQRADGFTKPLHKGLFRTWCSCLLHIPKNNMS